MTRVKSQPRKVRRKVTHKNPSNSIDQSPSQSIDQSLSKKTVKRPSKPFDKKVVKCVTPMTPTTVTQFSERWYAKVVGGSESEISNLLSLQERVIEENEYDVPGII
jgi:hypothetical protein